MYLVVSRCILMYLNGTHRNTCEIHARYMQDTFGYVLYRKPPPICIGNPPSPRLACRQWTISSRHRLPLPMTSALPITPSALPHLGATHCVAAALSFLVHRDVLVARHRLIDATHLCVASARACVRNGGRGVARTAEKWPRPLLPPPRSRPCCLAKNERRAIVRPKTPKTHRRKAARARRAAPAVARPYRHLGPSEQPSRMPPIAPIVDLEPCCIAVL